MTTDNPPERGSTRVERWFQHVVQALTVMAIAGGTYSISEMRRESAVITEKLANVERRFDELRDSVKDRYTATDAKRDIQPIRDKLLDHEARLRALERPTQ